MAGRTLVQRISLEGTREIKDALKALGKDGEEAFKQLQKAATRTKLDAPFANLRANIIILRALGRDLGRAFEPLGKSIGNLGDATRGFATNMTLAAGAIAAAGAASLAFAKSTADSAEAIKKQSDLLGISVEAFQQFSAVARENEIDQGQLEKFLTKFTVAISEAGDETKKVAGEIKKATGPLNTIGTFAGAAGVKVLTLKDGLKDVRGETDATAKSADKAASAIASIAGDDAAEKLKNFALSVAAIEDPAKRIRLVMDTFGGGIKEARVAVPFFVEVANNIRETGSVSGVAVRELSALEVMVGVRLANAFDRLETNLLNLKAGFAVPFQAALAPAFEELNALLVENQDKIRAFAQTIVDTVQPVIRDLFNAIAGNDADVQNKGILKLRDDIIAFGQDLKATYENIVKPVFDGIVAASQLVADAVNGIFGTEFTGRQVIIAAVIGTITGAFAVLAATIGVVTAIVGGLITAVGAAVTAFGAVPVLIAAAIGAAVTLAVVFWDEIVQAAKDAAAFVVDAWTSFATFFETEVWQPIADGATEAWDAIKAKAEEAWTFISDGFEGIGDTLTGVWDGLKDGLEEAVNFADNLLDGLASTISDIADAIKDLFRSKDKASSTSGGGAGGFASGGLARGPGGPTGDKIPAWISDFEFIQPAKRVRQYGVGFMEAIRQGRLSMDAVRVLMGGMPKFSMGGLAHSFNAAFAMPRFADGGLARGAMALAPVGGSGGRPFNLVIDGQSFGPMAAPPDVADELTRFAMRRQLRSAGQKPSWYGSGR